MRLIPVKTRVLKPPRDDLYGVLDEFLPKLQEGDVLCVTSKVLSIHQGRCVAITPAVKKDELVKQEAEYYLPGTTNQAGVPLTIKEHTLIPSAGIDESNAAGYYVLWPQDAFGAAREICQRLKQKYSLPKLAVIITDSHTIPLRWGVVGISIGWWGLNPLRDYRGLPDIFGRKLTMTQSNVADALAAAAVLIMGEGDERQPLVVVRDASFVEFTERDMSQEFVIAPEFDLYAPLLKVFYNHHV
ncbi:MAG: coenzyme F420-0:L-glutamate ligase [Candidatus Kerfeldbacteria bacterium]|nr:coenzyme F420-0:L-glutamate ligase [Candidatus Kerfeldbacteria bacterium]